MQKPLLLSLVFVAISALAAPPSGISDADVDGLKKVLGAMVAADTTNPPGNEARVVKVVAERLRSEDIPYEVVEFAPGRENIVARLKGSGAEKPVLLIAHTDVVGTTDQAWTTDPHRMIEKDGFLYGRGTADDLGMAAIALEEFIRLKKTGTPLRRDVILALTGDEESGGAGLRYLLANRPELVDAADALNESGGVVLDEHGQVKLVGISLAEKTYRDFTVTAKGATGHSSVPVADNAIYNLARALERLAKLEMPAHLMPVTRAYFARRATLETGKLAAAMRKLATAKSTLPKDALREIETNPTLAANLRTTCVATMVQGGTKVNALPPVATANINCRILPDETIEDVRLRLVAAVADPKIDVRAEKVGGPGRVSPNDGPVPSAIEKIAKEMWPGAPVIPMLSRGATDSRYLREKGVAAYGIAPIANAEMDMRRAHGIDERIPLASLRPAIEFFHRVVLTLAASAAGEAR